MAATGTAGASGGTASPGATDPLTASINPSNVLGQGQNSAPIFLYGSGSTASGSAASGSIGKDLLIRAGVDYVSQFNLAGGDKLDLTQILAGASLAHDLANLGNFVQVLGSAANDLGFGAGTKTSLEITGPHGTAVVNLEGSGKLALTDLLSHHSLVLPPH